jgi:hypothetical protein
MLDMLQKLSKIFYPLAHWILWVTVKIDKGNLVVMKGKKIDTSYKLHGNTVTSSVAASTSIEPNNDDMVLWHMRFGHLGELTMFKLK